jgi:hypothetical protein
MRNLNFIKEHGIEKFIAQQKRRIRLLEKMIKDFDDGRSRSHFCNAACLHDLASLENSLHMAVRKIKAARIKQDDTKAKAKILKEILNHGFCRTNCVPMAAPK